MSRIVRREAGDLAPAAAHHVALDAGTDERLEEQKGIYEELGYTECSEIKDRNYFHSIYCRCPGGILVECAATAEGGFSRDEPYDALGIDVLPLGSSNAVTRSWDVGTDHDSGEQFPGPTGSDCRAPATPGGTPPPPTPVGIWPSRRQAVFIGGDGGGQKK